MKYVLVAGGKIPVEILNFQDLTDGVSGVISGIGKGVIGMLLKLCAV